MHSATVTILEVAKQGPPGPSSKRGGFFLEAAALGYVVSTTLEIDGKTLASVSTDAAFIDLTVGVDGSAPVYTPSATVNGVDVVFTETSTKRWFTGVVRVNLLEGVNTVEMVSSDTTITIPVTRVGLGPAIQSITFGAYPGVQTELKSGDVIGVTINTDMDAVEVTIIGSTTSNSPSFPVVAGVATGNIAIGAASGFRSISAKAKNSFGSYGTTLNSGNLLLSQVYPTFSNFIPVYPVGKTALDVGDSADVYCTIANFDSASYSSTVSATPGGFATYKTVTNSATVYANSGTNYTVTANRVANNATASFSGLVKVAAIPATASISIGGTPTRLVSSPTGTSYEVRVAPSQELASAPTLAASAGTWVGSWTFNGTYWYRTLKILDTDPKGAASFSGLAMTGLSLINGTVITSGANFTVGGIASRVITFPAYSRVAPIGTSVSDSAKTSATIVGGNTLTRFTNNSVQLNGYFIANSDGTYNQNGSYLGLSDSALTGANTSGTLQVTFQETA